jgi:hypothetical protein
MKAQDFNFEDFSGGMNSALSPQDIADNQVVEALNMVLGERKNLKPRAGTSIINSSTAFSGNHIVSLHTYARADSTELLFAIEDSTNAVRLWNGVQTWSTLTGPTIGGGVWDWAQMGDFIIGVTSNPGANANPILISGTFPTTYSALGGGAPKGATIAAVNGRVFIASATNRNQVYVSVLGDPQEYVLDAGLPAGSGVWEIGYNDGGFITGLYPFRIGDRQIMVVFKRYKTYAIVFGSPPTDQTQWEVIRIFDNVGCIDHNSIQQVMGDLFFLSDDGLLSFNSLLQTSGDISKSRLSDDIPALSNLDPVTTGPFPSAVLVSSSQYIISVVDPASGVSYPTVTYVMDYSGLGRGEKPAWFKWDGNAVGTAMTTVTISGKPNAIFAKPSAAGNRFIYKYAPTSTVISDDGVGFTKRVITKSYSLGSTLTRKKFHRVGIGGKALTTTNTVDFDYWLNGNSASVGSLDFSFTGLNQHFELEKAIFSPTPGNRGKSITFRIQNSSAVQSFMLKNIKLSASPIGRHNVDNVG